MFMSAKECTFNSCFCQYLWQRFPIMHYLWGEKKFADILLALKFVYVCHASWLWLNCKYVTFCLTPPCTYLCINTFVLVGRWCNCEWSYNPGTNFVTESVKPLLCMLSKLSKRNYDAILGIVLYEGNCLQSLTLEPDHFRFSFCNSY